jgi:hypothetical protein
VLPQAYGLPAAILLVLGGTLACFAGYRLLRIVLGIYGFILGAMLASSVVDVTSTLAMLLAAVVGGFVGAIVLVFAYFVGVALVGAGLGALIAHVVWTQVAGSDPPALAVIIASVLGAIGTMILQRYVIVVATAFGGAWTIIVGGLAVASARGVEGLPPTGDPWILYPFTPAVGEQWVPVAWVALGLVGTIVQLALGRGRRKRK